MQAFEEELEALAERTRFSGVVRIDGPSGVELSRAFGFADRAHEIPNLPDTRFGLASGTKGLTALAIVRLIQDGSLELATTARAVLGADLPLIDDAVTVEHLLCHRSGIGDFFDEDTIDDIAEYFLPVPVRELVTTEQYLAVLDGHEAKFPPGEGFSYCNGGYVVLALIAERVSGMPFDELVRRSVCEPAGMPDTEFLRSDELPGRAAIGYLAADGLRSNVFHLPVRGSGDGGIYSTAPDIRALWMALFDGRIVSPDWVSEMIRPRAELPDRSMRYGLGFWLGPGDLVEIHGYDAGVSFRSTHDPGSSTTRTVISNTSEGTWPLEDLLHGPDPD
ncbi:MAG TPA: serine hydrolase domain-containing protein [Actinomycetota bacterium]